jgi:hypothetical protein
VTSYYKTLAKSLAAMDASSLELTILLPGMLQPARLQHSSSQALVATCPQLLRTLKYGAPSALETRRLGTC